MYIELLQELGLSPNEAKIYETLLQIGVAGVGDIATKANIHRRNAYDALQRLVQKGLVFTTFQKKENRYSAVDPNKLMELVREKETHLASALPQLQELYQEEPPQNAAYIYKGIEGYKNYRRDLLRVSKECYFIGAKGLWLSPQIDEQFRKRFILPVYKEALLKQKLLFDPRVPKQLPQVFKYISKQNYKVLPEKYSTHAVIDIFGDYVVTFTGVSVGKLDDNTTLFVMRNKELANSYRTWFQFIWDHC
jgi:sugar-specific transcriptional regulator TrmB